METVYTQDAIEHDGYEIHTRAVIDPSAEKAGNLGIISTVYRNGIQLGEDSLWDVELDGDGMASDYIQDIVADVEACALDRARETLENLTSAELNGPDPDSPEAIEGMAWAAVDEMTPKARVAFARDVLGRVLDDGIDGSVFFGPTYVKSQVKRAHNSLERIGL